MTNRIPQKELNKLIKRLLKHKIPFKKISTNGRTLIVTDKFGSYENSESMFPAKELHFIKSVKEYIIKNKTYRNVRNYFKKEGSEKKIKYFYYNKRVVPEVIFENAYEIDIKNAYWDTAYYQYNMFTEEIYNKGLSVSKKSRLAAIGSLAKTKNIEEFDGIEQRKLPPERSKRTEYLWNTICKKIGKIMYQSSKVINNNFLFFWVDAVFVKDKQSAILIQKFLKKKGYHTTMAKCEWVKFNNTGIIVKCTEKGKWIETKREEVIIRDGKKFIKTIKGKEWRDERPFPYSGVISETEVNKLAE